MHGCVVYDLIVEEIMVAKTLENKCHFEGGRNDIRNEDRDVEIMFEMYTKSSKLSNQNQVG